MVLKLGENLRNLRKDKGITQEELAYTPGETHLYITKNKNIKKQLTSEGIKNYKFGKT